MTADRAPIDGDTLAHEFGLIAPNPSIGDGVVAATREGADAIVIGAVRAGVAVERMIDRLPAEQRDLARALCADALLGTIGPVAGRGIVS